MYAFNINGDHFKICLMVIRLTFVIFQMMSFVYTKAGRSNNHFAPCHQTHHFTPLSPIYNAARHNFASPVRLLKGKNCCTVCSLHAYKLLFQHCDILQF